MEKIPSYLEIIQASLDELRLMLLEGKFMSSEHEQYARILKFFLSGDIDALEATASELTEGSDLHKITYLRLQNLQNYFDQKHVQLVEELINADNNWSAEAAFALGMSYLRFRKNLEAKGVFKIARQKLTAMGAHKKSVKALLNIVVAESRINNSRMLFADYKLVAEEAKKVGDSIVEGICYQNISKEMQILGSFQSALNFSNKALDCQQSDHGNLHYYETLLHRCHVLMDLKRFREAYADYELAKMSPHPQIQEGLKCIEALLGEKKDIQLDYLEPAWRSKLKSFDEEKKAQAFTNSEARFLELLLFKPMSRDEIVTTIYGDAINWESAKNRFKVFLLRFKKKYPHLIAEENGMLILLDPQVLKKSDIA